MSDDDRNSGADYDRRGRPLERHAQTVMIACALAAIMWLYRNVDETRLEVARLVVRYEQSHETLSWKYAQLSRRTEFLEAEARGRPAPRAEMAPPPG